MGESRLRASYSRGRALCPIYRVGSNERRCVPSPSRATVPTGGQRSKPSRHRSLSAVHSYGAPARAEMRCPIELA